MHLDAYQKATDIQLQINDAYAEIAWWEDFKHPSQITKTHFGTNGIKQTDEAPNTVSDADWERFRKEQINRLKTRINKLKLQFAKL